MWTISLCQDQVSGVYKHLYCPPFVLAPPSQRSKKNGDADPERSTVSQVFYKDQNSTFTLLPGAVCQVLFERWPETSVGKFVRWQGRNGANYSDKCQYSKQDPAEEGDNIIEWEFSDDHLCPSFQASARRVGLKRLFDWILSVMSLSLVPWRLVIGRLGRIGHGELRGWSTLLSRKSLKKAIKQLKVIMSLE